MKPQESNVVDIEIYDLAGYDGEAPNYKDLNGLGEFPVPSLAEAPNIGDFVVLQVPGDANHSRFRVRHREWFWMRMAKGHSEVKAWIYVDAVVEEDDGAGIQADKTWPVTVDFEPEGGIDMKGITEAFDPRVARIDAIGLRTDGKFTRVVVYCESQRTQEHLLDGSSDGLPNHPDATVTRGRK